MADMMFRGGIDRRDFLKIAGLVTGATVTMPLQAYARFLSDGRPPLKVGMVLPASAIYPAVGKNLADGMRLQFKDAGWGSTRLLVQETGSGNEIMAARRLMAEQRVDILTGMFNPLTVHRLRDNLEQSGTLFINMEGGANTFIPHEESPLMYQNSLGYWQSSWAMGNWAASNLGRRAAVISSFYETGYDSANAFPQGFESSGGRVIHTVTTHGPLSEPDLGVTMAAIAAAGPDLVFVSASGQDALDIVTAYRSAGLLGKTPLAVSAFTMNEGMLTGLGGTAEGTFSCLPWTATLDNADNRAFCLNFKRFAGNSPDSFAVLGYDTGGMIVRAVAAAAGKVRSNQDVKAALKNLQVTSPRGQLVMSPATGSSDAPLYICRVRRTGSACLPEVVSRFSTLQAVEKRARRADLVAKSGWVNSYLCV